MSPDDIQLTTRPIAHLPLHRPQRLVLQQPGASFGALGRRGLDRDDARRSTADGASRVASTIAATAVLAATGARRWC